MRRQRHRLARGHRPRGRVEGAGAQARRTSATAATASRTKSSRSRRHAGTGASCHLPALLADLATQRSAARDVQRERGREHPDPDPDRGQTPTSSRARGGLEQRVRRRGSPSPTGSRARCRATEPDARRRPASCRRASAAGDRDARRGSRRLACSRRCVLARMLPVYAARNGRQQDARAGRGTGTSACRRRRRRLRDLERVRDVVDQVVLAGRDRAGSTARSPCVCASAPAGSDVQPRSVDEHVDLQQRQALERGARAPHSAALERGDDRAAGTSPG